MQSPVDADETAQRRIGQSLKNVVVSFHTVHLANRQYTRQKDKASADAGASSPENGILGGEISGRASPITGLFETWPCYRRRESAIVNLAGGNDMAKNRLRDAAVKIGSAVGKVDSTAHKTALKAARAAHIARQELIDLTKQVDELKRQLKKSAKRLKSALK